MDKKLTLEDLDQRLSLLEIKVDDLKVQIESLNAMDLIANWKEWKEQYKQ